MNLRTKLTKICAAFAATLALSACGVSVNPTIAVNNTGQNLPLERLTVPPGFRVQVLARVPQARQMALSPSGTIYVGTRNAPGDVIAVVPEKTSSGTTYTQYAVAKNLHSPNGVDFRDGALYVAEISRLTRYDNVEADFRKPPQPVLVTDNYPKEEHHGWKYIRFGPDGWLYVPIGAPCNICESADPRMAGITRIHADGSGQEIFARGIRNTVGFDWDPKTKEMWFTDNGRDWLGEDKPPDELNHAPKAGMHFGYPYCHGKGIPDPQFGKKHSCSEFTPCEWEMGPHVAALGMRFYNGSMFPADYTGDIIACRHGSWNRSHKIGYDVVRIKIKNGHPVAMEPFITGWLDDRGGVWGRPVDVVIAADGSVLISDDLSGTIYRVSYEGPKK